MFVALAWSIAFTLVYGYVAARSRRAERVLIPLLDILQSVPVLGFLSITVTAFIVLFRGSLLGLEFASVFAIFTAQAWNMTFSFYQSLRSIPKELEEAADLYGLSAWERFTKLEVPSAIIGLVWNAMLSFGGSWFFLAASEAISVLNQDYTLPGVGSYVAAAIAAMNVRALIWAAITIAVVIVIVDQLFWRPVIAWSDRFRLEQSASAHSPHSWLLDILRRSVVPGLIRKMWLPLGDGLNRLLSALSRPRPVAVTAGNPGLTDVIFNGAIAGALLVLVVLGVHFIIVTVGIGEAFHVIALGLATLCRVLILVAIATVIWVPVGVTIGFNPNLARVLQPVVQFLSSFPANFIFPFATLAFIKLHISINLGAIVLMALGSQWYILFNTIAGAQSVPNELREMSADFEVRGRLAWRRLIVPGIFASWVTGAITASGGAWNASIVSEVVSWGSTTLSAYGIGSYIAAATAKGDWARITLGVAVMSIFVVVINRLVWRRLYRLGEERFAR
jgi:NitT/TauT family transport system permease protein